MGTYEARAKELAGRFAVIKPSLSEGDAKIVETALDNHAKARDAGLVELASIAGDKGESARADTYATKLDDLTRSVCAPLNTMLEGISTPPDNLKAFRDIAAAEEARFFEALAKVGHGASRDSLMQLANELEFMTVVFGIKWKNLDDTEKDLLQKERYAAAQLRDTVKKAFEEAVPGYQTGIRDLAAYLASMEKAKKWIDEKAKAAIKRWLDGGGTLAELAAAVIDQQKPGGKIVKEIYEAIDVALEVVIDGAGAKVKVVGKVAKILEPMLQGVVDRAAIEIRDNLTKCYTVIVTFSTTRREATYYVKESGYDKAKSLYDQAKKALDDCAANGSDALRTEASIFAKEADAALSHFLEEMRKAHATFVDTFKGILVESVSTKVIESLTDQSYLEEWHDGIEKLDFDQKLKELYGQLNDLNGDIEKAFGQMDAFTDLPLEGQSMIQTKVRSIVEKISEPYTKEMAEELKKLEAAQRKPPKDLSKDIAKMAKDLAELVAKEAG